MPASKLNYLVVYDNHSQVYGCSSAKIAHDSPPPEGQTEEDKKIFFITYQPDTSEVSLHRVEKQEKENE
jgi:hypothetical protein